MLFAALARAAAQRLGEFNAQNLANTALMRWSNAHHFKELAKAAERRVREFHAQNLANTAWAFAAMDQPRCSELFTASGKDGKTARGEVQCAVPREHSMSVCEGGAVR